MFSLKYLLNSLAISAALLSLTTSVYAGNDFVYGDLRVDLPEIKYAGAYDLLLYAVDDVAPTWTGDFTTA